MSIRYQFSPTDRQVPPLGNLDDACIVCSQNCSIRTETIRCPATGDRRRRGLKNVPGGSLYLCTDETLKSSRLFHEKVRAFSEMIPYALEAREDVSREASDYVRRLVHNLVTLNAQTIQAVYRVVPQMCFHQRDRESLIRNVSNRLSDPKRSAVLLIDILKNANLEKTEFSVYAKLWENEPIHCQSYAIHKIFMLILNTYWDALRDKSVEVRVGQCKERVYVDYDIIAASLVHLLDNTVKYVLPESRLDVSFRVTYESVELTLDMISVRIRESELHRLTEEGFSGMEPKKIGRQGDGRGLYLVTRLLSLTGAGLEIESDCDIERRIDRVGVNFENNIFRLSMPRDSEVSFSPVSYRG